MRIEPDVYVAVDAPDVLPPMRAFVPPLPVYPVLLDLPLITGDEAPHAPHLAVSADPWPGQVAVYASATDSGYALNHIVGGAATVGEL